MFIGFRVEGTGLWGLGIRGLRLRFYGRLESYMMLSNTFLFTSIHCTQYGSLNNYMIPSSTLLRQVYIN